MPASAPTFRADHIGSLLRPERLLAAAKDLRTGKIDAQHFRALQDECIREVVAFQEAAGMRSVSDGEFRRRGWSAGFIDAVEGFGMREGTVLGFRDQKGEHGTMPSPYAETRLARRRGIATDEFAFLKKTVKKGVPKVTIPAPDVMHFFLGPKSVDERVYPDIEQYYADLAAIYKAEIADLSKLGCTYLQLDDTALPCNCDAHARADVKARGEDPDQLTERYVRLANEVLAACPPDMAKATHMCRGNLKGQWMAEGGYEAIAERVFGELNVDAFLLEFDSARAGGFAPLRFVAAPRKVVLGLVSTKTPQLESADELKRRIDEAAKFIPLDRLGISPQCGFSSVAGHGQPITFEDQKRKMELLVKVAQDVWGSA